MSRNAASRARGRAFRSHDASRLSGQFGGHPACTLCRAWGSAAAFVPPAMAMSGLPPPLPPTCWSTKLTSSPALILPTLSLVTPAAVALGHVGPRLGVAKVHLVNDSQQRNLEQDGVQPRPADSDVDLAIGQRSQTHVFFVELEQAQKIHKVALDEAQREQVADFVHARCQLHAPLSATQTQSQHEL